ACISVCGNIKYDQPLEAMPGQYGQSLRRRLGLARKSLVIVAGSTHAGEDRSLVYAFSRLKRRFGDLKLIIAPRHLNRCPAIAAIAAALHLSCSELRDIEHPLKSGPGDVIIVNAMGLLRSFYAVADIAFVGGSLVNIGGHNPLEPAALGKPILFGPYMHKCKAVAEQLTAGGGARYIVNENDLVMAAGDWLSDEPMRIRAGRHAGGVFSANQGAVDKTIKAIESLI
ncbi:MAG: hypothetical protein HKP58_05300, partial [Desulfatitalea sp.]|nr:hypothetical protein [Desulfatitalea sp.]NNJ99810.1 hypothetical protein [Desulfatitalea sp.]